MIYELSLVTKSDLSEDVLASVKKIVHEVSSQYEGEVLLEDDWGRMNLAQPTSTGTKNGHFVYFIFTANSEGNKELARRFKINDHVMRSLVVKLGEDSDREEIVKGYKTPFSKNYNGSVTDDLRENEGDNPKRFARSKSCWFKANQISADWKDPQTYQWLVNEFGKISAARISGVSMKHQRLATIAIKRARQIGIASYVSGRMAETPRV
tara:strand:- start:28832 stop:29458 length:627 start_codon:yes stop_codon:yes gene_type:complete